METFRGIGGRESGIAPPVRDGRRREEIVMAWKCPVAFEEWQSAIVGLSIVAFASSCALHVANRRPCEALESFGTAAALAAGWMLLSEVDCKVGRGIAAIKRMTGQDSQSDFLLGEEFDIGEKS